ncbi:DnaJ domain-containing protein [Spirulina sp. CS-785/01]|uniref:J domain-containing protein n=1 Tax=Spirulina sp. CS-785/01 TaxID=3021716 RepID=UPI00232E58A5|nr:DnaJ domain-containing protein [Spirulina sp. CS-785/01]MDB9313199.1 DnaJ domain-containing protein [Spirulina sp. CS-785/01]
MNYYQTLQVNPQASQAEIKHAYRRLVKQFHPDSQTEKSSHERIIQLNAAYEVLSDPQRRLQYDQQGQNTPLNRRYRRTATAQQRHQAKRTRTPNPDQHLHKWLKEIYDPIDALISPILQSLDEQIEDLAADPFDDDLMADFQDYLQDCRRTLEQAQRLFRSQPNPPTVARKAAHLYYCLNHILDGLEELDWFPFNYDEEYLHTGQEFFRRAERLRQEAANG